MTTTYFFPPPLFTVVFAFGVFIATLSASPVLAASDAVGTLSLTLLPNASSTIEVEFFTLSFSGTGTLDLTDWTVEDNIRLRHTFGPSLLADQDSVTVCGGTSSSTGCDEEIDSGGGAVWNNSGDTFTLRNSIGEVILTHAYGSVSKSQIVTASVPIRSESAPEEGSSLTIEGIVWHDQNEDGLQDADEPGLPEWEVTASNGEQAATTTTAAGGIYELEIPAGEWTVSLNLQAGWEQTAPTIGVCVVAGDIASSTCDFGVMVVSTNTASTTKDEEDDVPANEEGNVEEDIENTVDQKEDTNKEVSDEEVEDVGGILTGGMWLERREFRVEPKPEVLGVASSSQNTCEQYLTEYLKMGWINDPVEVIKLQLFLTQQGLETPISGVFDEVTDSQVRAYQAEHSSEILDPWSIVDGNPLAPNGYVYKTTRWKINDTVCPESEVFPELQ